MKTHLFIIALVITCSFANTSKSEEEEWSVPIIANKPFKLPVKEVEPFDGKEVHFILTVQEEIPNGSLVYRNKDGEDMLGMEEPLTLSSHVKAFIEKRVTVLKNLLISQKLWSQGFANTLAYSFATHDMDGGNSRDFFSYFAEKLFNEEGPRKFQVSPKTLTEGTRQSFFAETHEDDNLLHLINFSYGYYRKATGLNLIPEICPGQKNYLGNRWTNVNEYKAWLSIHKFDDIVDYLSTKFEKKEFTGALRSGKTWTFSGKSFPLRSSAHDLYNFLETVIFDNQFDSKEIPDDKLDKIRDLREKFLIFYLSKFQEFVGNRFFTFVKELLNDREEFSDGVKYQKYKLKKWLFLGASDLAVNYMTGFLEDKLKTKFAFTQAGESLSFFFAGTKQTIDTVYFYYSGAFVKKVALKELLEYAIHEPEDHRSFNKLCINKEYVESFENDF